MEISLTEYVPPNGRKVQILLEVSDDVAALAKDLTLSCELLSSGVYAFYARRNDELEEEEEIALVVNAGEVTDKLSGLIRLVATKPKKE